MTKSKTRRYPHPLFRVARILKYFLFALAALITFWYPTSVIFGTFESVPSLAYLWSGMLFLGSMSCLLGVTRRTWTGEFIGLPGVICCLFLYSISSFVAAAQGIHDLPDSWRDLKNYIVILAAEQATPPLRLFLALIFLGFTFSSLARHQDVQLQKHIAEADLRRSKGRPGL